MSVKNFVQCSLTTPVAAGSTELILVAPVAPYVLPPADGGVLVIADSVGRPTFVEVIRYTSCSGNVLYGVTRGQEGTTARAWSGPTFIYQALTADEYTIALAGKEPSIVAGTAAQMWLGNKSWASVLSQVQGTLLTGLSLVTGTAITATDTVLSSLGKLQKQITDAATNLAGNVRGTVLTGLSLTTGTAVAAADTVLVAVGKLQKQVTDAGTNLAANVRATAITGYVVGTNAALAATDTVLGAMGKIQGQLNGKQASLGYTAENTANKGVANGYAGLDATGKVPAVQLPSFVDDVLEFANLAGFPATGETSKIYVDLATNKTHRWSGSAYVEISASPGSTDAVTEGSGNLYFTESRVRATLLTGYAVGVNAVLAAGDSILGAFQKLQAQITGLATSKLDASANAVSASKLQTARTIGGVSFDGTANINLPGVNAAGNQSTSGNAATATKLQTTRTINGVAFDGTADITVADPTKVPLAGGNLTGDLIYQNVGVGGWARGLTAKIQSSGTYTAGIGFLGSGDSVSTAYLGVGSSPWSSGNGVRVTAAGVTISGATTFDTLITGSVNGNAATATKLQTARTIGGVSFDGSANINLPGVNAAGNQSTSGNAATATKLATARTINGVPFDGSANINIAAGETGRLPLAGGVMTGQVTSTVSPIIRSETGGVLRGHLYADANGIGLLSSIGNWGLRVNHGTNNLVTDGAFTSAGRATFADSMTSGWYRSTGAVGWYNETYGGGIYMSDATYVRTYNGKQFACTDAIQIDGAAPQIRLNDTSWGVRYLYHDAGLIGFLSAAGGWTFQNDNSGNTTSIGNVTAYSDIRLKKDIELIPDALDKVCALRGVTYERIDSGERQTGVIAQEVQAVLPEAVMTMTDEQQTLSVAYGNLVGLLIEAIKELKAEVDVLKQGAK